MSDNAMAMVSNKSSPSFTLIKSVHLIDFFGTIHKRSKFMLVKIMSRIWMPLSIKSFPE